MQDRFVQHLTVPGLWLERGVIDATDERLLQNPPGLAGQRCMASIFFAAGSALERNRRDAALDAHPLVTATVGATSPNAQMVVVRVLAPHVEPAMKLLKAVRVAWREVIWGLEGEAPRVWGCRLAGLHANQLKGPSSLPEMA